MSERPLYLQLVSSHVQLYDVKAEVFIEQAIEKCSVRELVCTLLMQWCDWLSWNCTGSGDKEDSGGWVSDVLRLLVLSKLGLTIEDLLTALPTLGYHGNRGVSKLQMTSLIDILLNCLLRYNERGLLTFTHQHLKDSITHALISKQDLPV